MASLFSFPLVLGKGIYLLEGGMVAGIYLSGLILIGSSPDKRWGWELLGKNLKGGEGRGLPKLGG